MNKRRKQGFTLVELMIVVAILAVLVSIAIPKFSNLVSKSRESTTKGNLGVIRSALSAYYGNVEGIYPSDNLVGSLTDNGEYLIEIPPAMFPTTRHSIGHISPVNGVTTGDIPAAVTDVAGGAAWLYNNVPGTNSHGSVVVNCAHRDYNGSYWSSF